MVTADGIRILASPPQAPRANAICDRITGTLRREFFDRLLIVSEHHLRRVLTRYLRPCNAAQPHRACPRPDRGGSGSHPATGDQPRRAPDPRETGPRRTHTRVPDDRLTGRPAVRRSRSPRRWCIRVPQVSGKRCSQKTGGPTRRWPTSAPGRTTGRSPQGRLPANADALQRHLASVRLLREVLSHG